MNEQESMPLTSPEIMLGQIWQMLQNLTKEVQCLVEGLEGNGKPGLKTDVHDLQKWQAEHEKWHKEQEERELKAEAIREEDKKRLAYPVVTYVIIATLIIISNLVATGIAAYVADKLAGH